MRRPQVVIADFRLRSAAIAGLEPRRGLYGDPHEFCVSFGTRTDGKWIVARQGTSTTAEGIAAGNLLRPQWSQGSNQPRTWVPCSRFAISETRCRAKSFPAEPSAWHFVGHSGSLAPHGSRRFRIGCWTARQVSMIWRRGACLVPVAVVQCDHPAVRERTRTATVTVCAEHRMTQQSHFQGGPSDRSSSIATDSTHKPRRWTLRQGFGPDRMLARRS